MTRPGALAGVKYFLCAKYQQLFMDDRCGSHGADVFISLSICDGYSHYIWFLYMKKETSIEESTKNVEIF